MRRWFRWLVILIVVVGIVSVSFPMAAWWQERSLPKYLTAKVSRGPVETVVNSSGTIKPVRMVSVGAFTSGPIKEVFVDYNTEVTQKDQVLALIDDRLAQAAVDRDEAAVATQVADLERVKALLEQAERDERRAVGLREINKDYISDTELDQFKYKAKSLKAQRDFGVASILQAKATLKNSQDQLNYTRILGPKEIDPAKGVRGKVIERKVDPGQTVAASFQTPELFTIALEMDKHMHVYASVDEADIGMVRRTQERKQKVEFTVDAYPAELFKGDIYDIRLNSTTTQNVVTYPVIIDAPNLEQKLKPGMTANITFPIEGKENVLRVPASALRFTPTVNQVHPDDRHYLEAIVTTTAPSGSATKRSANEKAVMAQNRLRRVVWVQEGALLRAVPITLGLIENQFAEVISGDLTDGQVLVTGTEGALAPK